MTIAPATDPAGEIEYRIEPALAADDFIAVLETSGLAERRPVTERARIETMLSQADIIVTARHQGRIVGVSRALADFGFCCYLSDLAVDRAYQGRGIGKRLVERTWDEAGRHTTLILLAAPKAVTYYPHIGMRHHDACFVFDRQS
ncbi:MAG: GNAT family N-acetyltransferase [Rhodospirillaceae bacterium]|nr:GNAT family N-acetyltransferase [Rhodospirillaceae bacterium]